MAAIMLPCLGATNGLQQLVNQGFNAASMPAGWSVATNAAGSGSGIDPTITFVASSTHTNATPYEGSYFAKFNSWDCRSGAVVRLTSPAFSTRNCLGVQVDCAWFQDNRIGKDGEGLTLQWSTNGSAWTDLAPFLERHYSPTGWARYRFNLPATALNKGAVYIGFKFNSVYGNNCYLDDVRVMETDRALAEGFNHSSLPGDWSTTVVADPGADPALTCWATSANVVVSTPAEGYRFVKFNSWDCPSGAEIRLVSPSFSTVGHTNVDVHFAWHQDSRTNYDAEGVTVQWSVDGATWSSLAPFHTRRGDLLGWSNKVAQLPAGAENQGHVALGFLFHSQYGNNCYLDDVYTTQDRGTNRLAYPYRESFESGFGVWENAVGDAFNWSRLSGDTPSDATGPSSGYGGSGYYLYTEADGRTPASNACLQAAFDFGSLSAPRLWFKYHMFDYSMSHMGSLYVDVSTNGGATWADGIWSKTGAQQWKTNAMWAEAMVYLLPYAGYTNIKLRIRGVTGTDYRSDMAIDDVLIMNAPDIKFQGFEGAESDTWGFAPVAGAGTITTNDAAKVRNGAYALSLKGSVAGTAHPYVEFNNVALANYTNVNLLVCYAATGLDTSDDLYCDVSYDDGSTWTNYKLIDGNDAYGDLNYDACGPYEERHPQMANPFTVFVPDDKSQIKVRVRFQESVADNRGDTAYVDSIKLMGEQDTFNYDYALCVSNSVPTNGQLVVAGSSFTKTWTMTNAGNQTWSAANLYAWARGRGDGFGSVTSVSLAAETVGPGQTKTFSAAMVAPTNGGVQRAYWSLRKNGTNIGERVWIDVVVDAPVICITNTDQTVLNNVSSMDLAGTNQGTVAGQMRWTNSLTGAQGTLAAAGSWSVAGLALGVGTNCVTVRGTNAYGVAAGDSVTIVRGSVDYDSDSDGVPDLWEEDNFPDDGVATRATDDPDGDTLNNREEWLAGTEPTNAGSVFGVSIESLPARCTLSWGSISARSYAIYYTTNLNLGFGLLTNNLLPTPPLNTYTNAALPEKVFFRLKVQP